MKRLLIVAAICVIAAPAFASPEVLPIKGIAGSMNYSMGTHEQTPAVGLDRAVGPSIWASTQFSGFFWGGQGCNEIALDWGDIQNATVGTFAMAYATNADPGFTAVIGFYDNDNGWNNGEPWGAPANQRQYIAVFELTGLAGTRTPDQRQWFWGWIYKVSPVTPMIIASADLDGDALGDWSYTYWWDCDLLAGPGPGPATVGPIMAGDPNAGTAPGIENTFDIYNDPNYVPAPGYVDPNLTYYIGSYWFGGTPFAQFYMELFAPQCPNKGEAGRYCQADIGGSFDCLIALDDLAQLLGHYGCTTGCTLLMGDVDPYDPWFPGDGVIALGDLAELLGQYGDDCNWPPTP